MISKPRSRDLQDRLRLKNLPYEGRVSEDDACPGWNNDLDPQMETVNVYCMDYPEKCPSRQEKMKRMDQKPSSSTSILDLVGLKHTASKRSKSECGYDVAEDCYTLLVKIVEAKTNKPSAATGDKDASFQSIDINITSDQEDRQKLSVTLTDTGPVPTVKALASSKTDTRKVQFEIDSSRASPTKSEVDHKKILTPEPGANAKEVLGQAQVPKSKPKNDTTTTTCRRRNGQLQLTRSRTKRGFEISIPSKEGM